MTATARTVRPLLLLAAVAAASTVWVWCTVLATIGWAGAAESGDSGGLAGTAVVCIVAALIGGAWVAGALLVIPWNRDWRRRERSALSAGAVACAATIVIALIPAV